MAFTKRYDTRQTFCSDRLDKALGKRVQIRTTGGQPEDFHTTVPQQIPSRGGVERVSVDDQVAHVVEEAVMRVGEVPHGLSHPAFVRLTRDAGDLHGPRFELHH